MRRFRASRGQEYGYRVSSPPPPDGAGHRQQVTQIYLRQPFIRKGNTRKTLFEIGEIGSGEDGTRRREHGLGDS